MANGLLGRLQQIRSDLQARLVNVDSAEAAEAIRVEYLGKKGALQEVLRGMGALSAEERPVVGKEANMVKEWLSESLSRLTFQPQQHRKSDRWIDLTAPGTSVPMGHEHPIRKMMQEINGIFERMGFWAADGPEVETEYYNFEALNIPADHPSRDGFDTFYLSSGQRLLRSHTSSAQIRVMEKHEPPLRVLSPGRVYRPDAVDASHSFSFHQVEGFMVDRQVSFADLKGTLSAFAQELFGPKTRTRFRPHFFPFTEPSVEMDFYWKNGWLEILGAGMIHPNVLRAVQYDTDEWQGFAFGMGVERLAMIKYGIDDIRLFSENDLRFLEQF
ncbi:MAG: phenylalanine--tRNA ligase subunit alpha [Candidatus Omnitrophica bacterium]|nr:phenylalanine--tRNA ligase subunit alpha [Candidatus Omnitrophota bacterium]